MRKPRHSAETAEIVEAEIVETESVETESVEPEIEAPAVPPPAAAEAPPAAAEVPAVPPPVAPTKPPVAFEFRAWEATAASIGAEWLEGGDKSGQQNALAFLASLRSGAMPLTMAALRLGTSEGGGIRALALRGWVSLHDGSQAAMVFWVSLEPSTPELLIPELASRFVAQAADYLGDLVFWCPIPRAVMVDLEPTPCGERRYFKRK